MVQLKNLDLYLLDGRARIAEARRKFQELAAEDGTARAEAALAALKRAREQLLDPITVLGEVAQDEAQMIRRRCSARRKRTGSRGRKRRGISAGGRMSRRGSRRPRWPSARTARDRLEEVRARLAAGVEGADKRAAGRARAAASRRRSRRAPRSRS